MARFSSFSQALLKCMLNAQLGSEMTQAQSRSRTELACRARVRNIGSCQCEERRGNAAFKAAASTIHAEAATRAGFTT
jgi:hypothetical protein